MKKAVSILLMFTLILSLTGTVLAYGGEITQNYELAESKTSIIEPYYVPCDYWPDGHHRWQDGNTYTEYEDTGEFSKKPVLEDGYTIGYNIYEKQKIYKIKEQYCACGMTRERKTYKGTRWKKIGYEPV